MMPTTEEFAADLRKAMPWAEVKVISDEVLVTVPPERQEEAISISKAAWEARVVLPNCNCDVCQCYGDGECQNDLTGWDPKEI